jgi:HK97 family phage prohead protease
MLTSPPGWRSGQIGHRFASGPASYDADSHSCECAISLGSPVRRSYGEERLRISQSAINASRVHEGGVPLLNSHNPGDIKNVLGRIVATWIRDGVLWGKIAFASTPEGKRAEQMVRRGELRSVSAGYSVEKWSVADSDGNAVDPDDVRWSDDSLVFTAERWTLIEVSLVATPADQKAMIRSLGGKVPKHIKDVRARMQARQAIIDRMRGPEWWR